MGGRVFKALACCDPPLSGKAMKLFFSPLPKTLSLHFNSALADRGQIPGNIPSALHARQAGQREVTLPRFVTKDGLVRSKKLLNYLHTFVCNFQNVQTHGNALQSMDRP